MDTIKVWESPDKTLENLAKAERPRLKGGIMSSVVAENRTPRQVIQAVGELLAPQSPAKRRYGKILAALTSRVPVEFRNKVTERRVRGIHNGDARRIEWYEMKALLEVEALEEARLARLKLAATAHRLAALLETEDASLDREERRELGRLAGALDRAGIKPAGLGEPK